MNMPLRMLWPRCVLPGVGNDPGVELCRRQMGRLRRKETKKWRKPRCQHLCADRQYRPMKGPRASYSLTVTIVVGATGNMYPSPGHVLLEPPSRWHPLAVGAW